MHAAPPVRIPVAADALARAFTLLCTSWAAANLVAWVLSWAGAGAWLSGVMMVLVVGAAVALMGLRFRRRADAVGLLTWDTGSWHWAPASAAAQSGTAQVMIDLGPWLLLRFNPAAPLAASAWLAISRRTAAGQWSAWRAALYAPRPESASPAPGAAA
jgi:hypothetical protein